MSWSTDTVDGAVVSVDTTGHGDVSLLVSGGKGVEMEFWVWLDLATAKRLAGILIEAASEEEKLTNKETKE